MRPRENVRYLLLLVTIFLVLAQSSYAQTISRKELIFYTQDWKGARFPDGRPKVSDDILKRMKNVSIEEAWGVLRSEGYYNQYEGGWTIIHPDQPIVGRAVTAAYMPSRPGMQKRMEERGHKNGRSGAMNSWPIDELQKGDVYVADGYGKAQDGTLIGDRLGNTIYANSGNGVVFNGSVRDLAGLEAIDGFNAFVRNWNPSYLQQMMLTGLNTPIRIGHATVLPGDVVLAKKEGVVFIPAQLAAEVVKRSEMIRVQDEFAHQRVKDGTYTAGQMDSRWTDKINTDFTNWLRKNEKALETKLGVGEETIDHLLKSHK